MDHHVPRAITSALRARGIDVLTAAEDAAIEMDDRRLLDRATSLGRVLVSQDVDLLAEASRRQRERIPFGGVVFAHQLRVSIAACIVDLELIATAAEPADVENRVLFLPL